MALEVTTMPSAEIEQYQETVSTGALALSDRQIDRIERLSRAYAKTTLVPERYRGEQGEADLFGVGISLTILGCNFDPLTISETWVMDGKVNLGAQISTGICKRRGYDTWFEPGSYDETAATISVKHRDSERVDRYTYTIEMARKYGLLNEWAEKWEATQSGKRYSKKVTVAVDGERVPNFGQLPEWARKAAEAGDVKRKDPWFGARTQMLMARAATLALKKAAPEALLGMDLDDEPGPAVAAFAPRSATVPPGVDPDTGEIVDDEVVDAEIVEEAERKEDATGVAEPEGAGAGSDSGEAAGPRLADDWDRAALRNAFTALPTDELKAEAQAELTERGISLKNPDLTQDEVHEGFRFVTKLQARHDAEQKKAGKTAPAEQPTLADAGSGDAAVADFDARTGGPEDPEEPFE